MVAFTRGALRWTVLEHGAQTARGAASTRLVRLRTQCVAFAQQDGICRQKRSLKLCLPQSEIPVLRAQCSNRQVAGIIEMMVRAAMARMITRSRHCLLAAGTTMSITPLRATARVSGVLQRAVTAMRTT